MGDKVIKKLMKNSIVDGGNGNYSIYFSTTYDLSVYDTKYKTLVHTHLVMVIAAYKVEYRPPNKGIESERNFSLTLSSVHPERSLEAHERFHPEKLLINQDLVRWDGHSVTLTNLGEDMIT